MICKRCRVSGRVQGVFYRATTRELASKLDLTGYAHNLPDGRVEVLACGDEEKVRQLCEWLWQGPVASKVESVECKVVDVQVPGTFSTG